MDASTERMGKYFHFDNDFWANPVKCGFLSLYQIGELCCERGFKIEEHEQSVYEITYVISGHGYSYVDGEKIRLTEGDVLINSMGHQHAMEAGESDILRYTYIGFRFNEEAEGGDIDDLKTYYDRIPYQLTRDRNNILIPFMRCMDEFFSKAAYSQAMIRNYCEQIVILATRETDEEEGWQRSSYHNAVSSAVYAVIRHVEDHIDTIGSIRQLADKLGYNYTYLSHFFKEKTGTTLQKYISYKKVERALQLLKYGKLSVSQIAEQLNYESVQSFSKAFRRVIGYTPTKYLELEQTKDKTDPLILANPLFVHEEEKRRQIS